MKFRIFFAAVACSTILLTYTVNAEAQTDWPWQHGKPVLTVGAAGAWDSKDIETGSVVLLNDTYRLWYSGFDGTHWKIGYALSFDGISWIKYDGNPVLDTSLPSTWDDYGVYRPAVLHDGVKFHMWYTGFGAVSQIGHATSDDGIVWLKDPANPVIEPGIGALEWDGGGAYSPSAVFAEGIYRIWYTGYCSRTGTTIGYAESPDGTAWTKYPGNPVIEAANKGWEGSDVYAPSVVFDGAEYHLWYVAWRTDFPLLKMGFSRIGYATSANGLSWTKYVKNPVVKPGWGIFTRWDGRGVSYPSVILDGDQFKMWFVGDGGWGTAHHEQIGYITSPVNQD